MLKALYAIFRTLLLFPALEKILGKLSGEVRGISAAKRRDDKDDAVDAAIKRVREREVK